MAVTVRIQATFTALIVLLGIALVLTPLLEFDSTLRLAVGVVAFLAMGAAVWKLRAARWLRATVATTGVVAAACTSTQLLGPDAIWIVIGHVAAAAFVLLVSGTIVVAIWEAREVDVDTIVGGIAVYLLLAVAFATSYQLVEFIAPGSFVAAVEGGDRWGPWESSPGVYPRLFFFSFVTLTTLGYGDVVPASPVAAGLASLEALIGPLYLAILIARLVGLHATSGGGTGGSEPRG
jgi:hypothetical protein